MVRLRANKNHAFTHLVNTFVDKMGEQKLCRYFEENWCTNFKLKADTENNEALGSDSLFQNFTQRTETAGLL